MNQIPRDGKVPRLRIFTVYHEDSQIDRFGLREDGVNKLYAVHRTVEGENMNPLHVLMSEMVAMYWVWKNNVKSEWVGFRHYHDKLFEGVENVLSSKDVCIVGPFGQDVNLFEQYTSSFNNCSWDIFERALADIYGQDNKYHRHFRERHNFYQCCSFVMPWEKFTAMCEEMFKVAKATCDKFGFGYDLQKYLAMTSVMSKYHHLPYRDLQDRCMGHILERFISAWINMNFKTAITLHETR